MKGRYETSRRQKSKRAKNIIEEPLHENEGLSAVQVLNLEQKRIAEWLEKLRFRKQVLGGVNEQDVWRKIDELNGMYEAALNAERIRYDVMIDHFKKSCETTDDNSIP